MIRKVLIVSLFALLSVPAFACEEHAAENVACKKLDYCGCQARSDCEVKAEACLCPSDFQCEGAERVNCVCGGGKFLGCKEAKSK